MSNVVNQNQKGSKVDPVNTPRLNFSTIKAAIPIPSLLDIQLESYTRFLQIDQLPGEREDDGLHAVFQSVFPIWDFRQMIKLDYVDYTIGDRECKCGYLKGLMHLRTKCKHCGDTICSDPLGPPDLQCNNCGGLTPNEVTFCQQCGSPVTFKVKYDVNECKERGLTYAAPLKVTLKLEIHDKNPDTGEKHLRDIKEQEVFFGDIPLMTDAGTFIISGTERVIVSQLHRSPGVFFESDTSNNRTSYLAKIIPYRGSWVEFEYDQKNILNVRIDRKRKFLGTVFLRALGLNEDEEILSQFYKVETAYFEQSNALLLQKRSPGDETDEDSSSSMVLSNVSEDEFIPCTLKDLKDAVFSKDIIDPVTEEIYEGCEGHAPITKESLKVLKEAGFSSVQVDFLKEQTDGTLFISKHSRQISNSLVGTRLLSDIKSGRTVIGRKGRKLTPRLLQQIEAAGIKRVPCLERDFDGAIFATNITHNVEGEETAICFANDEMTGEILRQLRAAGIQEFRVIFPEKDESGVVLSETLRKDTVTSKREALLEIYRKLRPGDPPTPDTASDLFEGMFFEKRKYDLSRVGRMKFNIKMYGKVDVAPVENHENRVLTQQDFFETIEYLFKLRRKIGETDDIDHLGNRRVRSVGELLENAFRIGLIRMERAMKERMTVSQDMSSIMPHELINAKPVMASVREFFGSSQLSQYMDQINPLAEITHKRRLSALGPGGLTRERASFEVRDVHPSHYGRICPIETPEGPNIGLISSLSCYARINEFGFIESPYRRVKNAKIVDEVHITYAGNTALSAGQVLSRQEAEAANAGLKKGDTPAQFKTFCTYLSAWEEDQYIIAQANLPIDEEGNLTRDFANCRVKGDFQLKRKAEVQYLDVSPKQLVSVAASLIPFFENDDAKRALMASNMQRQAVPLLRADSPIVGTGMERIVAKHSGAVVLCKRSGVVDSVDSERIIVRVESTGHEGQISREIGADIYPLAKFRRTNQNTCINQKPVIHVGDTVQKGQILADGPCTHNGELSLGRNVVVAFMPWRGYNFEDAILVSERLVEEDHFTSLHIEEFEIDARDTKLGPEEITRDIPNISESFLRNLDESGVIRIGATVKPGDILVGKVIPKGEQQLTPEEKLLRAIFGEKAGDVKDASLHCPSGILGTVVGAKVFSHKGIEKDSRAKSIEAESIERFQRNLDDESRILLDERAKHYDELLGGETVQANLIDETTGRILLQKGEELTRDHFYDLSATALKKLSLKKSVPNLEARIEEIEDMILRQVHIHEKLTDQKIANLKKGDELLPGVLKRVKVFIAMKRKLSVGDKMAGRHGNKGVIARILPQEDMPFLPDGSPVEIVLNPLGVPSRMNVGQILETHLGWAGQALGVRFAAPVFEGPSEMQIKQYLKQAGLPTSGKTKLYDGISGIPFEQEVTVGVIYMLKLNHLVDDKIHARSIGPYSLITQQPLGGKAQFGGQRFGEMEVWALEAYGAAHILRELLTVKSDDVAGRGKIYESIVKGESALKPGVPESFHVLVREMQSLCLDVALVNEKQDNWQQQMLDSALDTKDSIFQSSMDHRINLSSEFESIQIGLASPEKIRGWSFGEVTKPETINYRTLKPERDGLFCTAIFGPMTDWECLCGKYKRMKHRGVICDKCGTEVTLSKVRRERLGHIELAAPCSHVWFFKTLPSRIGQMLDITMRDLERVLYYEAYIVVESDNPDVLPPCTVLSVDEKNEKGKLKYFKWLTRAVSEKILGTRLQEEIKIDGKLLGRRNQKVTRPLLKKITDAGVERVPADMDGLQAGRYTADVVNKETGEVLEGCERNQEVTTESLQRIMDGGIKEFDLSFIVLKKSTAKSKKAAAKAAALNDLVVTQEDVTANNSTSDPIEEVPEEVETILLQEEEEEIKFEALMGAEGIKECLARLDLNTLSKKLREQLQEESSVQKQNKLARRLKVIEAFRKSSNKPEWMILNVLPVIPPELRPLVPLDGGRFATSDLNDLYRRVINRNNRLNKLINIDAPEVIIRNEKRMLQEAVDALLDNGRRGQELRGANKRPLKSLADTLKGKQGRFRQNLLGKRVDYSGRSVIVVGPELKLHQCGLPKKMALELFKPFIYQRLEQSGQSTTIKQAKEIVEQQQDIVWDILEEVIKDHPVLLNRAPTLHRLGIQAFEPVLVEGNAIKIHPLVCTAFNADFDGDQMAVHVPLSPESLIEAYVLMLSSNNILSPANGKPITTPSQDIVLGVYYLTKSRKGATGEGRSFGSIQEVLLAYDKCIVETQTKIRLNYSGPVIDLSTALDNQNILQTQPVFYSRQYLDTTVGRVLMNDQLPAEMPYINGLLKKKGLSQLVSYCYRNLGRQKTVVMLDKVKELGFLFATLSGTSPGIDDMIVPEQKEELVTIAQKNVMKVEKEYKDGAITHGERYNKIIEIWNRVTENVSDELFASLEASNNSGQHVNPLYVMSDSGARGSKLQTRQLCGMRGLMAKPSGEIIETPITANFREGLNVLQYFISTHGARKGLADTALKTANSGYLTRRLVDVAQDVIITEEDCGTIHGLAVDPLQESGKVIEVVDSGETIESLRERIIGRVALDDIRDYEGTVVVKANEVITEELATIIESAGIKKMSIRSVLTCATERGVCQLCYGCNIATNRLVERGEAVGVIAAQSIGEPGTQLTMRTFHIGGAVSRVSEQSTQDTKSDGFVKYIGIHTVHDKHGELIAMNRNGIIAVVDQKGHERERYPVVYGAKLRVEDGQQVSRNQIMIEWDPFTFSILTESEGTCVFHNLQEGVTLQEQVDEVTGMSQWVVTDPPDQKKDQNMDPRIEILDKNGRAMRHYLIPTHSHLMVQDGTTVHAGEVLAKIPRETTKTKDITGGLPRVVELFEARRPGNTAVISEIDGIVKYGQLSKGTRKISVIADDGEEKIYAIPRGVHINVQENERIRAGEPLMDGPRDPRDILAVLGDEVLQRYLVSEIQEVYALQGIDINDKHLEVIIRQMMRWVKVDDGGSTNYLTDEIVDKFQFQKSNAEAIEAGQAPASGKSQLMGISRASLSTKSFISAASFQETTRILTDAAVSGKNDPLIGLKENVIVGRLVPAGTGHDIYERFIVAGEDEPEELVPEVEYLEQIPSFGEEMIPKGPKLTEKLTIKTPDTTI